jgi:hypothetical protein
MTLWRVDREVAGLSQGPVSSVPPDQSFVGWPLAACKNASLRQKTDLKVGKSWNGNRFLDFMTGEDVCLVLTPCLFDHLSSAFFAFLLASLAI